MFQRKVRLLVVEDNTAYMLLIHEAFEHADRAHSWQITEAKDGEQALSLLSSRFVPDLILLDWQLPKVSGNRVLQFVKEHKELRKIPVLVFSSSNSDLDIHEAYGNHANGYIAKPDNMDVLYQIAEAIEHFWVATAKLAPRKAGAHSGLETSGAV
jgi:CheY-like chemotaxis protein